MASSSQRADRGDEAVELHHVDGLARAVWDRPWGAPQEGVDDSPSYSDETLRQSRDCNVHDPSIYVPSSRRHSPTGKT
jgi:hypothetical protein